MGFSVSQHIYIVNPAVISFLGLDVRKPDCVTCKQQRCRPAPASAQSDQHLCCLLSGKNSSQPCSMQNFNILATHVFSVAKQAGLSLHARIQKVLP